MLKNYIITALRALSRHKVSAAISIISLTLGLASAFILWLFIDYHRSFDNFVSKDIHRLISKKVSHEKNIEYRGYWALSTLASDRLAEKSTQTESMSRLFIEFESTIGSETDLYNETTYYVDPTFFDFFSTPIIEGDKNNLFPEINSVVIDKYMAEKLFPEESALGKSLYFTGSRTKKRTLLTVTGVIQDLPKNSHLYKRESHIFIPFDYYRKNSPGYFFTELESIQISLYFKTIKNFSKEKLLLELTELEDDLPKPKNYKSISYDFENIRDCHINSKTLSMDPSNPKVMILMLAALTLIMLIISIINTVSILTAQSISRVKEVGIRTVLGGERRDIIFQFLTESVIISFISLFLSMVAAELFLTQFSNMVKINIDIRYTPLFCIIFIILTLIVGIISGLYPAFYLSSLRITETLKGKNLLKLGKFKKILILFQFIFASLIIVSALIFNNELNVLKKLDVGFNPKNLIYISSQLDGESYEKLTAFKERVKTLNGVKGVTFTSFIPWYGGYMPRSTNSENGELVYIQDYLYVDSDYFKVMELELLSGSYPKDLGRVAVLESSIDRDFSIGDIVEDYSLTHIIDAIINDYYPGEPTYKRYPMHIVGREGLNYPLIRVEENTDLSAIKKVWREIFPNLAFEYGFVSTNIQNFHSGGTAKGMIYSLNTAMAITLFVSFLGLFGLLYHSIEQKSKEIGIRKVIGAGYKDILFNFFKEFLTLITLSTGVGVPLGITVTKKTLESINYPFPVSNTIILGISAAGITLLLGAVLITVQTRGIIMSNPSKTLRYE